MPRQCLCRNQRRRPFSNWGKAASPEKLKHEAAVAALTAQIQLIELEASQRDPLFLSAARAAPPVRQAAGRATLGGPTECSEAESVRCVSGRPFI